MTGQPNRIGQRIGALEMHKRDRSESAALPSSPQNRPTSRALTQWFRRLKEGIPLWYFNIFDRDSYRSA